jgi:phosphoglycerate kinase
VALRTLEDVPDLRGQVVFLRVDANVPISGGVITDDGRIRAFLPTLHHLLDQGAKVVIGSHLGRPAGIFDQQFSLAPVATRLEELSGQKVNLANGVSGEALSQALGAESSAGIVMLENLRFDERETSKDDAARNELATEWSKHVAFVVEDGFGVVHRKQASVYELAGLVSSAAGLLIQKEVDVVTRLTSQVEHPYTVVLGGSKVSDKLGVIEALLPAADYVLVGGGMVFTVLSALGHKVGRSLVEPDQIPVVRSFLEKAKTSGVEIVLPTDIVMAAEFAKDAPHSVLPVEALETGPSGSNAMGLDIGPESSHEFASIIEKSMTVFWNGPMGVFEFDAFSAGTKNIAKALAESSCFSVVGGGDSAAAVRTFGYSETSFGHISTGGGASLEFLEGKVLPGLEILGWTR